MKKIYKKPNFKKWHDNNAKKLSKQPKRNKKYNPYKIPIYKRSKPELVKANPVIAPSNICLFEGTRASLIFFSNLRKTKNISKFGKICFVQMDISKVNDFDYSSICVLIAIIQDLKSKKIYLRTNYPDNPKCKKSIIESGLLTFMFDEKGKRFKKAEKSDLLFIEKGSGKLTRKDNKRISDTLKKTAKHLTDNGSHLPKLRRILLEICGNSIEWGGTINKQWLLGVRYEDERVILTITDVGKGILKTLNKKFKNTLQDVFTLKSNDEIVKGAFIQKYGSSTNEINRNKGLPSIKNGYDNGVINKLKVLTNNVLLDYENEKKSEVLKNAYFSGTLYRWEITKETIQKAV